MTVWERAVFFSAGREDLFGILSAPPAGEASDVAVVILAEAVPGGMRGQNAVMVRLARAVARAGYVSFRFDYHGVGESTGATPVARRESPFVEDLDAAFDWLRMQGHWRFLVVGSCFGAHTALLALPGRAEIRGVALLSCLVAGDNMVAPSTKVVRALTAADDQGVAVLFCYGRDDPHYAEFEAARPLGLEAGLGADGVEVETLDGHLHSFLDVDLQERAIETVVAWVTRVAATLTQPVPVTWTSA
jgi:alpha/beta superfamily hydrolase